MEVSNVFQFLRKPFSVNMGATLVYLQGVATIPNSLIVVIWEVNASRMVYCQIQGMSTSCAVIFSSGIAKSVFNRESSTSVILYGATEFLYSQNWGE